MVYVGEVGSIFIGNSLFATGVIVIHLVCVEESFVCLRQLGRIEPIMVEVAVIIKDYFVTFNRRVLYQIWDVYEVNDICYDRGVAADYLSNEPMLPGIVRTLLPTISIIYAINNAFIGVNVYVITHCLSRLLWGSLVVRVKVVANGIGHGYVGMVYIGKRRGGVVHEASIVSVITVSIVYIWFIIGIMGVC